MSAIELLEKAAVHLKDRERVIDGSKVTGLMDDVWIFDNGHASNCVMIKGGGL